MDTLRKPNASIPEPSPESETALEMPDTNPLAQSDGRFQDDPFWEEMLNSIRQHRQEMDAEWNVSE
jgi:hypothetical protein